MAWLKGGVPSHPSNERLLVMDQRELCLVEFDPTVVDSLLGAFLPDNAL